MFICPHCHQTMTLPTCTACGDTVDQINHIWQLTDLPDRVTEGEGDHYIGYEHIGEHYSGNRRLLIEERDALFAQEIAEANGDGVFLDLACGDGCFTVPCAALGTRIIAGDISNTMLGLLQQKAEHNHIPLSAVTLCRMNALEIPLESESVDTVVANSMLHLISNPEKVIREIHRVLKKGGVFICKDDTPGRVRQTPFDNTEYFNISSSLYGEYWEKLKHHGILPKKYSWKFDRAAICDSTFSAKHTKLIERGNEYASPLGEVFLPRFMGRGYSDQVDVPKELHDRVMQDLLADFKVRYGDQFTTVEYKGIEEDLLITFYTK